MSEPQRLKRQRPAVAPPSRLYTGEQFLPAQPEIQEDEISLLEIWQVLVDYKWLIALMILLSTASATTYAILATPVYRAEILMISATKDAQKDGFAALAGQFGGLASLVGVDVGGGGGPAIAIATLKSRQFTRNFIKEENLLPALFDAQWNADKDQWRSADSSEVPALWQGVKKFDGIRSVFEDKKSGFITLAIEWKDPALAAQWATQQVDRINKLLRDNAVANVERNLNYLRKKLESTDVVAVQQSLSVLIEAEIKKSMLANVNEDYAFRVVDPAVVPEEKVRPKRAMIVIVGLFLGCMFGVFVAFMLNFIKNAKRPKAVDPDAFAK